MITLWWFLFSWATAITTLIVLVRRAIVQPGPDARPVPLRVVAAAAPVVLSILLISLGYALEPALLAFLQESQEAAAAALGAAIAGNPLATLLSGLVPGSFAAFAAASGSNRARRMERASIAVVATLMLLDSFWNLFAARPLDAYIFSLLSDLVGGVAAGIITGWVTDRLQPQPAAAGERRPAGRPAARGAEPGAGRTGPRDS